MSEHVDRFTDALEIWDHPLWREQRSRRPRRLLRVRPLDPAAARDRDGLLVGAEDRIATLLDAHEFDYVVGSVHFVRDRAVDWDVYDIWEAVARSGPRLAAATSRRSRPRPARACSTSSPTPTWSRSGAIARPRPERDPRFYYEPAVEAIAETGIAVEVSTAGLRKPVGELYPSRCLRARCASTPGRSFALSSDAHVPEDVGRDYDRAVERMRRAGGSRRSRSSSAAGAGWSRSDERSAGIGIGYDSHRFAAGRRLVLGGVEVPHEQGLDGHSDADVLTHAVIDALLGAAGLGDLGTHFPADEERWRDADSIDLLQNRARTARRPGRQRRRDRDLRAAAARSPSRARWSATSRRSLGAPVSVKATTNEGMGWIGRGEGIAALAVALARLARRRVRGHGPGPFSPSAPSARAAGQDRPARPAHRPAVQPPHAGRGRGDPPVASRQAGPGGARAGPLGGVAGRRRRRRRDQRPGSADRDRRGRLADLRRDAPALERARPRPWPSVGSGPDDGVAIMCRNHRGFVEATLAVSKLGASGLYMNTAFSGAAARRRRRARAARRR